MTISSKEISDVYKTKHSNQQKKKIAQTKLKKKKKNQVIFVLSKKYEKHKGIQR